MSASRRSRRWPWLVAAAASLVVVAVLSAPASDVPYAPDGVGPDGLRGVVDLLRSVDVEVVVSLDPPGDAATRVFVPVDRLGTDRREALLAWVRDGGTLIVAGTTSPLHDLVGVDDPLGGFGTTERELACDPDGLVGPVEQVAQPAWNGLQVPAEADGSCGEIDDGIAWLVVRSEDQGKIVAIGSPDVFVNARLGRADNAVLAAALLGPAPGDRLVVVPRPPVGEGDTSLLDLVAPRVWQAGLVLLVALLVGLIARARRFGPPVPESLPPVLPASELAVSVGELLQRAGDRDTAARRLRADARRRTARALGLAVDLDAEDLAVLAARRTGTDARLTLTALTDTPVPDDQTLVGIARAVHVLGSRLTPGTGDHDLR